MQPDKKITHTPSRILPNSLVTVWSRWQRKRSSSTPYFVESISVGVESIAVTLISERTGKKTEWPLDELYEKFKKIDD